MLCVILDLPVSSVRLLETSTYNSQFIFLEQENPQKCDFTWASWCKPVIPALERQRQEDHKLKASLGNIV
jgi:hypothetical protein